MKLLICLFALTQIALFARSSQAQVINFDNSRLNYNSNNGVYDNNGQRLGYEVKAPGGVTNYFDKSGNRIGYSPAQGRQ